MVHSECRVRGMQQLFYIYILIIDPVFYIILKPLLSSPMLPNNNWWSVGIMLQYSVYFYIQLIL